MVFSISVCRVNEINIIMAKYGETDLQLFSSSDKPKEEKKDTFLEKLATQVIKNVQVKITGIHIKYEDDVSYMNAPQAV